MPSQIVYKIVISFLILWVMIWSGSSLFGKEQREHSSEVFILCSSPGSQVWMNMSKWHGFPVWLNWSFNTKTNTWNMNLNASIWHFVWLRFKERLWFTRALAPEQHRSDSGSVRMRRIWHQLFTSLILWRKSRVVPQESETWTHSLFPAFSCR